MRRIDPATTIIPFVIILILCVFFVLSPAGSTGMLTSIRSFLGDKFGI